MGIVKVNKDNAQKLTTTLIFGDMKTGKTNQAISLVEKQNPLFIVFGNLGKLPEVPGIAYIDNPTEPEMAEIVKGLRDKSAEYKDFGALVLDGLLGYAGQVLTKIAGAGASPTQAHWGVMSKQVADTITRLRQSKPLFVATCLTDLDPLGVRGPVINKDLLLRAGSNFTTFNYCSVANKDGKPAYVVQTEPALAMRFVAAQ